MLRFLFGIQNATVDGVEKINLRRSISSRSPDSGYGLWLAPYASSRSSSSTLDSSSSYNMATAETSGGWGQHGSYFVHSPSAQSYGLPISNTSKPYQYLYPDCLRRFSRSNNLARHAKTHFREDTLRYDCPERGCRRVGERGFTRWDNLVEHKRNVHMKETRKLGLIPEYVKKSLLRRRNFSEKEEDIPKRSSPVTELGQNEKDTGEPSVLENTADAMDVEAGSSNHDHFSNHARIAYSGSCPNCHYLHIRAPFEVTRDPSMQIWFKYESCDHQKSGLKRLSTRTTVITSKAMPSSFSVRQLDTKASSACSTSTAQPYSGTINSRISKRIKWQCRCGHKSYDDFLEVRSGAVEEYESLLRRRLNTENDQSQNRGGAASLLWSIPGWNHMTQSMRRIFNGKKSVLPQCELEISPED